LDLDAKAFKAFIAELCLWVDNRNIWEENRLYFLINDRNFWLRRLWFTYFWFSNFFSCDAFAEVCWTCDAPVI